MAFGTSSSVLILKRLRISQSLIEGEPELIDSSKTPLVPNQTHFPASKPQTKTHVDQTSSLLLLLRKMMLAAQSGVNMHA